MLEVGVFGLDALPELAFPGHRKVLAEYLKSQARLEAAPAHLARAAVPHGTRPSRAQAATRHRRTRESPPRSRTSAPAGRRQAGPPPTRGRGWSRTCPW